MSYDVSRARVECPATTRAAYLNAGTFGPLPRVSSDAMHAHLERSFEQGRIGHAGLERWIRLMDRVREAFATTLAANVEEIALTHCTTDGCNTVVWGLPFEASDEVVTTTHEHPGLTAPLEELARVRGVRVHAVDPELDAIVSRVGPGTRLVALSHVLWTNGAVLPIAEIARLVRERTEGRAFVLVDGAQSVGVIDVAPATLGVDAYTVSGQKWLCGPSGTGALWVRPEALDRLGTPWPWYLSKHRGPSGASEWTSARRLDASTLGMTSLAGAEASLAWQKERWDAGGGVHAARLASELRARLRERAGARVVEVAAPSSLVSFVVDGHSAGSIAHRLEERGVLVRSIPGLHYVRASVGLWNDEADLERLVRALP
ncbi:MAG: aminotransferase class V-fold PLP-dependent enzyme [Sandaracinaceae bacterium]|nr:aminotransferase class V-fold PLP-dependent enzyme [Sandaracinaceae bacterium]